MLIRVHRSSVRVNPSHGPSQPPQHGLEQPIGYPHRPPSLRLESRRTSISMDDVVRRVSSASASSSPDSNLLRVQANLPGRRHSDNTIQPPRILVAPSSPTGSFSLSRGPSASNLHMRRHSSVGPQDPRFSFMSSTTHKVTVRKLLVTPSSTLFRSNSHSLQI